MFNDERELLEVRLQLLSTLVDQFVIVVSDQTFTGLPKSSKFPWDSPIVDRFRDSIKLVHLESLVGRDAWAREAYSRNSILNGVPNGDPWDLLIVSDIDEIPRPASIEAAALLSDDAFPVVLCLDYFNFKFNYKMTIGMQAVWAGPVITTVRAMTTPQKLRSGRWAGLHRGSGVIYNAGWHFSYLSAGDDVKKKLESFSHQEKHIQARGSVRVDKLIALREGFHSHHSPCAVWSVVPIHSLDCHKLEELVLRYPALTLSEGIDDQGEIELRKKLSVNKMAVYEQEKILRMCATRHIFFELARRVARRIHR
ncbi:hypothetical protein NKH89_33760 [Mesorhizobium sp. M0923]